MKFRTIYIASKEHDSSGYYIEFGPFKSKSMASGLMKSINKSIDRAKINGSESLCKKVK